MNKKLIKVSNALLLTEFKHIFKLMKLTSLFGVLCVSSAFAVNVNSQSLRVNISANQKQAKDVIKQIEEQTDYLFVYNHDKVNLNNTVTIQVNNETVAEVLNQMFAGTDIVYAMQGNNILLMRKDVVQQSGKLVTGTIVDSSGTPVIGANVMVKGTTNGTITDMNGHFSLEVEEGAVLQISYIGYANQEIEVGNQNKLSIALKEDAEALDELVVVGYGTAKKKDISGSVVHADLEVLRESPNVSFASALQGTVPGMNVGAVTQAGTDPEMTIRGRTSISGANSPLIVLDGIIYRGNLVDLNMNDIESIDILKDASSAAIYGSQASNGVLLITSKSVKSVSKPIIEYNGSFSIQQSANKINLNDREGYLQQIADVKISESRMGEDLLVPNPDWDVTKYFQDNLETEGYLNGRNTDWWDLGTNDLPYINNQNLSVRGKSELSSYFFSMGYTDQKNLMKGDEYQRYNIRMNLDTKVTDWLKVGIQSFFTFSDYSGANLSYDKIRQLPPLSPVTDENGENIVYVYKTNLNPLLDLQQDNVDKRYNLWGNFYVDVDIPFINGLNYRLNFSQNLINNKDFNFNPWGSDLTGNGSKVNDSQYSWTIDNIVTYKHSFDEHDANATFVYGAEKRVYESTSASGSNFSNGVLGFNNLGAADAALQKIASSAWQETSLYMMARLGYAYKDRYIFTGTVRRDGFSGFSSSNKFAVFPSAAVAWRLSEEDFLKDKVDWIDDLKLRLSYGVNGNRTLSRYQTMATMKFVDSYLYGDGAPAEKGSFINTMANDDLKWETTKTFNLGGDFSFLGNRIVGFLEFYKSKTEDLLYNVSIPYMNNNINSIATNIGELSNWGAELKITGVPIENDDFSWYITFNFSLNRNKVKKILGIDADGDGKEDDLVSSKIFIDKPYGVCYDFNVIGMWQVTDYNAGIIPNGFTYGTYKIEDIDGDGNITAANDRKILGYSDPSYRFSIQNTFRYKDFELKFLLNSIQGGKDYYWANSGSSIPEPDAAYQNNIFKFDYWTPENPNAKYRQLGYFTPSVGYNFHPYTQRSFVRLQDLTFSYKIPKRVLNKIGINNLKIYLSGKNLFTITKWDGMDPETGVGIQGGYPLLRSYSIGVNFDF